MILLRASRWAVVALLLAAACAAGVPGQDKNASTRAPGMAARTPAAASPSTVVGSATPGIDGTIVSIGDHFIDPVTVVVKAGTTVTWRNSSGQHDVTSRDGSFRSPTLGDSYSHTFTQPGRHLYFCSFHGAEMRGEIVVEPAN